MFNTKELENPMLGHYFDDVIISDEIKIAKPNPRFLSMHLNL